ncbi:MAG: EamA family transporter [Anaerolineae bacterium]|jgi:drug/metabolite transporter (DMT)-like permease|nr:EamA family transporter [Anaerolineae bacterium]
MTRPAPSDLARGYAAALGAAAVLSTTAIFIRHLTVTYAMPALVLAFWRDVFTVLTLLPILIILKPGLLRVTRRQVLFLGVYGIVLATFNAMWTLSVAYNGAAVATVLAYCSAAFTALLGWWLLKEDLDWAKIVAVALSLSGCVLVADALDPSAWRMNPLGILTGVLSGLTYAGYSLMGRSASQRGLSPWTSLVYTFAFAAAVLLLVALLPVTLPGGTSRPANLFWLGNSLPGWGLLFLLAAGPTVVGFGLYNVSLVYLPSSITNLIVTLEPTFTAVTAYFLLGETLTITQAIGGVLILSAVIFLRLHQGHAARRRREPEPVAA